MDPDVTWTRMVDMAEKALCNGDATDDETEMAELILALRDWIGNGGFPPKDFRGGIVDGIG